MSSKFSVYLVPVHYEGFAVSSSPSHLGLHSAAVSSARPKPGPEGWSEFCDLLAEEGALHAQRHTELFLAVAKEAAGVSISAEQSNEIFRIFAFLNLAYANGVWSNLEDSKLRQDLMVQSLRSFSLRTARELARRKACNDLDDVAFLAVQVDEEFRSFFLQHLRRMKELTPEGNEPDANAVTLCGLEWIQQRVQLGDDDMDVIVPHFLARAGDLAEIERVARQVNLARLQRKVGQDYKELLSELTPRLPSAKKIASMCSMAENGAGIIEGGIAELFAVHRSVLAATDNEEIRSTILPLLHESFLQEFAELADESNLTQDELAALVARRLQVYGSLMDKTIPDWTGALSEQIFECISGKRPNVVHSVPVGITVLNIMNATTKFLREVLSQ